MKKTRLRLWINHEEICCEYNPPYYSVLSVQCDLLKQRLIKLIWLEHWSWKYNIYLLFEAQLNLIIIETKWINFHDRIIKFDIIPRNNYKFNWPSKSASPTPTMMIERGREAACQFIIKNYHWHVVHKYSKLHLKSKQCIIQ